MSGTSRSEKKTVSLAAKLAAIQRVHNGESKASVARDIGVPESTLRGWCKGEHKIQQECNNNAKSIRTNNFKLKDAKSLTTSSHPYERRSKGSIPTPDFPINGSLAGPSSEIIDGEKFKTDGDLRLNLNTKDNYSGLCFPINNVDCKIPTLPEPSPGATATFPNSSARAGQNNTFSSTSPSLDASQYHLLRQMVPNFPEIVNSIFDQYGVSANTSSSSPPKSSKKKTSNSNGLLSSVSPTYNGQKQTSLYGNQWNGLGTNGSNLANNFYNSTNGLLAAYNSYNRLLMATALSNAPLNGTNVTPQKPKSPVLPTTPTYNQPTSRSSVSPTFKTSPVPIAANNFKNDDILYNRLTNIQEAEASQVEDLSVKKAPSESSKSPTYSIDCSSSDSPAISDNETKDEEDRIRKRNEAIEHGQKFLDWLRTCQDEPAITQVSVEKMSVLLERIRGYSKHNGQNGKNRRK